MNIHTDVPFRFESECFLWTVENVYSSKECDRLISLIEASAPTIATNNPMFRDQDRVIRDDPEISADLFRRLRPRIPSRMGNFVLVGLNERLRMYRYRSGQRFAPHMDRGYCPNDSQVTLHSVLVYLNADFEGGETRFTEQLEHTVVPKTGMTVIFQHKLTHEGCTVRTGTKYAMRTDVIYERLEGK